MCVSDTPFIVFVSPVPTTSFVISSVAIAESRNLLLEFDKGSLHKIEMTKGKNLSKGSIRKAFGKV
jgi:predicted ATP-grasp superfamily ATP-dependent carboligase